MKIVIPQLSGFWRGLFCCAAGAFLTSVIQHGAPSSWAQLGETFNHAALDAVVPILSWIMLRSPFKPSENKG
jgi:hypothetical protein